MTCKHCCGAENVFDLKGAQKEMKKYKRKGAGKTTKKLISLLNLQNLEGATLMDIGGGVGAIQWAFLKKGGKNTTDVDASKGYLEVARSYALEQGLSEQSTFLHSDLVDRTHDLSTFDYVTLDKVVCCYPDYTSLLETALNKCTKTIGLTYPLGGVVSKIIVQIQNIYLYFKKNPFRTYLHSPSEIEAFIRSKGFEPICKKISFPWHVQVYKRL